MRAAESGIALPRWGFGGDRAHAVQIQHRAGDLRRVGAAWHAHGAGDRGWRAHPCATARPCHQPCASYAKPGYWAGIVRGDRYRDADYYIYASTEASLVCANQITRRDSTGENMSVGPPRAGVELHILGPGGAALPRSAACSPTWWWGYRSFSSSRRERPPGSAGRGGRIGFAQQDASGENIRRAQPLI